MPFLSKTASTAINSNSSGSTGFLKIKDKTEVRFTILDEHPMEFYEVWATNPDNKEDRRTFRWDYQPTPEDVLAELGNYVADEKYDQPGSQNVKFTLACPVFNYGTGTVQVYSFNQTTIMKEIDAISQMEDYDKDITTVDLIINYDKSRPPSQMYTVRPVPRKKGTEATVAAAWIDAQEKGFEITRMLNQGNPFKAA